MPPAAAGDSRGPSLPLGIYVVRQNFNVRDDFAMDK
jgi:hypothetical protein